MLIERLYNYGQPVEVDKEALSLIAEACNMLGNDDDPPTVDQLWPGEFYDVQK